MAHVTHNPRPLSSGLRSVLKLTYSPYLNRAALRGREAVEQMADDFRMLVTSCGGVTQDDLEALGWPAATVIAIGKQARLQAFRDSEQRRAARRELEGAH